MMEKLSLHSCCQGQRSFPWPQFWTAAGMLVLFACALIFVLKWNPEPQSDDAERALVRVKNLSEMRAADEKMLTSYGWVDQGQGILHLPIKRAMELEVIELNSPARCPKAAYPIAPGDLVPKPARMPPSAAEEKK